MILYLVTLWIELIWDVGFGKTEIAMRAAFITVSAGFQVVLICPKVLLVNQHYETFKKDLRF